MSTTNINIWVSGYARGAASVRLLTVAPLARMSGAGVCPATDALRSRIGDIAASVLIDAHTTDDRPGGQQFKPESTRQFTHQTGFPDLRPPV